jgi:hypothetical protein
MGLCFSLYTVTISLINQLICKQLAYVGIFARKGLSDHTCILSEVCLTLESFKNRIAKAAIKEAG